MKYPSSINRYIQEIHSFIEDTFCPCCTRRLRKHGCYERMVIWKRKSFKIPILRRRCPRCDITFSLLPYFIIPYMQFANHIREFLGRWLLAGVPLTKLADRLSTQAVSTVSLRTLRRWKAKLKARFVDWWLAQRQALTSSPEMLDHLLEFYRRGASLEEERHLMFSLFFQDESVPRSGSVLSKMNLRLPPQMCW